MGEHQRVVVGAPRCVIIYKKPSHVWVVSPEVQLMRAVVCQRKINACTAAQKNVTTLKLRLCSQYEFLLQT